MAVEISDEVKEKVKRQVDFYFSDSNLPKDKFLQDKIKADKDGYVDLALVVSFQRMKSLLKVTANSPAEVPAEMIAAVAEVLRSSEIIEVDDEGKRLKRKQPLRSQAEITTDIDTRSLYAKPFPTDISLDALTACFNAVAPVNCVRLRRHVGGREFKGSVFVEFASVEGMEKALSTPMEYAGKTLKMERKLEYLARKSSERKDSGVKKRAAEGEAGEGEHKGLGYTPGCVLRFQLSGEGEVPEVVGPSYVKDVFGGQTVVRFVEMMGEDRRLGFVRFFTADAAASALGTFNARPEDERKIAALPATLEAVGGDEEKEYFERAKKSATTKFQNGRGRGRGKRGRH